MEHMVRRRTVLRVRLSQHPTDQALQRHAAVTTNLGAVLYTEFGQLHLSMLLYQEAVQTLMYVQGEAGSKPSEERQGILGQLWQVLNEEAGTPEARRELVQHVSLLYPPSSNPPPVHCTSDCIPATFSGVSKLKGNAQPEPCLAFCEAFTIDMDIADEYGENPFCIPVSQCSKATLFNMGLIHYHWGSSDRAVQFFDLAASLSSKNSSPLDFDPVVLGCLNNMAQIHLYYHRPQDALDMLRDALTRGNAALAKLYRDNEHWDEAIQVRKTRRLRRKLARTVLQMGHVHFTNCDYPAALATCQDALRLMHTDRDELEVAAVWYNLGLLHWYHERNAELACEELHQFCTLVTDKKGPHHAQVAQAWRIQGQIQWETGEMDACMVALEEALRIQRMRPEEKVPLAETLLVWGKVRAHRQEWDAALEALQEALTIQEADSFAVCQILVEIAKIYRQQPGQLDLAKTTYQRVAHLTKKYFGESHEFTTRIESILNELEEEETQAQAISS